MKQIIQVDKRTGIKYVYEYECYWDNDKKQSRYKERRLIGHIDKITGAVVANRPTKTGPASPTARRVFCGSAHLLDILVAQTGLDTDLSQALGVKASPVSSIAYYLLCEGSSTMSRFSRWTRTHDHPLGHELSSPRISELFQTIGQDQLEAYFTSRVARASGQYWFYDTTSISSYSRCIESVRWGRNKDRVPLPQINMATVLDAQTCLPVWFKDLAGNISDVVLIRSLLKEAAGYGMGKVSLCLDRGFYSKTNIDALLAQHLKFLIGLKTSYTYVQTAIEEYSSKLRGWQNYDEKRHVFGLRIPHAWDFEYPPPRTKKVSKRTARRTYLHLYYEPERVSRDEEEFAQLLCKLAGELASGQRQEEHETLYQRYFRRVRGGRYVGKDDAIESERSRFGYFALLSNDASLGSSEALTIYRSKDMIEKAFGDIKDRLDFRTPKVGNVESLRGKLLCVFVALTLASELRRRMDESGLNTHYTMQELLDELDVIERYEREGHRPRILAVTEKQKKIYEDLGVTPPTTS